MSGRDEFEAGSLGPDDIQDFHGSSRWIGLFDLVSRNWMANSKISA